MHTAPTVIACSHSGIFGLLGWCARARLTTAITIGDPSYRSRAAATAAPSACGWSAANAAPTTPARSASPFPDNTTNRHGTSRPWSGVRLANPRISSSTAPPGAGRARHFGDAERRDARNAAWIGVGIHHHWPSLPAYDEAVSLSLRQAAATKYKPDLVRLLLVAEAPPCAPDRYFYFERVSTHDWLFRYTWQGLTGSKPDPARKAEHLAALRDAGVFLIDLHEQNIAKPSLADLLPSVPALVDRCRTLRPERVVLIKATVYDAAHAALRSAGQPVVDERIPFPSSGQQKRFLEAFKRATQGHWVVPAA
jgi:hypothetical protein